MKDLRENNKISDDHYIYYLQLDEQVDNNYIWLAANLKSSNITLVPIRSSELDFFVRMGELPLIVLTDTFNRLEKFKKCRRTYLDFAMRGKNIILFHLNSFGHMTGFETLEKLGYYRPLPLPLSIENLWQAFASSYLSKQMKEKKWPGGRRVGLPKSGVI